MQQEPQAEGPGPAVSVIITGAHGTPSWRRTVESVLDQTLASVEALLVGAEDTGTAALSPPGGDAPRVRTVRDGLGEREAAGTYVMVLAAGQLLDRHACLTLFAAAERSGAQLVCGCGERVHDRCELGVHHVTTEFHGPEVDRDGALGGDSAAWLYRRSFLSDVGLWPAEQEHAAKAYAAADDVLVLPHGILRPAVPEPKRGGGWLAAGARLAQAATSARVKQAVYRRVLTRLPIRTGSVLFESHTGDRYGGSPRAVYEQLRAIGYSGRTTWSHTGSKDDFPTEATRVRRLSWAYYWALARAQYWVDDHGLPAPLAKRPGTTYLQTWHGPPVEFTGFDEPAAKLASRAAQRRLRRSVDRFDYLVVGSEYEEQTLLAALGAKAEPLRVGHPRNDALLNGGDPERLERLCAELDLDECTTTVLYLPQRPEAGLDLDLLARDLGGDFTLMADRAAAGAGRGDQAGSVLDVSDVHDSASLLLLADVLVTDHAPAMFDFALLDRPMIFYVPDLAERRRRHGAYFDLAREAPGPLVRDQRQLAAAIRDAETLGELYQGARREFAGRYGTYETGDAAARIVQRVFAPGRSQ